MRWLGTLLWNTPELICVGVLAAITAIVGGAVISRYLFFFAFTWAEELVRFIFLWLALIGGALAVKRATHFRLTFLRNALPARAGLVLDVLGHLCVAALGGVLVVYGLELALRSMQQVSPALEIPQGVVYLAIPLGGGMIVVYALVNVCQTWSAEARRSSGPDR